MFYEEKLTRDIIGAAIEVHKVLGPGLLESIYEECLSYELERLGMNYERQKQVGIVYKDMELASHYRIDLVVEERVIVELKSIEAILPVHKAQLLTYLKLTKLKVGLIINFNTAVLKDGIRRMVL